MNFDKTEQNKTAIVTEKIRSKIVQGEKQQFDYVNNLVKKSLVLTGQSEKYTGILTNAELINHFTISGSSAVIIYLMSVLFQNINENESFFKSKIKEGYINNAKLINSNLCLISSKNYEMNPNHIPLYIKNEELGFDLNTIILISEYSRINSLSSVSEITDKAIDYLRFALRPMAFSLELGELVVAIDELLLKTENHSYNKKIIDTTTSPFVVQLKHMEISEGIIYINGLCEKVQYSIAKPCDNELTSEYNEYNYSDNIYLLVEHDCTAYNLLGWILDHHELTLLPSSFKDYASTPFIYRNNEYYALVFSVIDTTGNFLHIIIQSKKWRKKTVLTSNLTPRQLKQIGFSPEIMNQSFRAISEKSNRIVNDSDENKIVCLSYLGGSYIIKSCSTVLDLSFKIHSEIGLCADSAIVNSHKVGLDYKLKNGDIFLIKTSLLQRAETNRLSFATTKKAKQTLRKHLDKSITDSVHTPEKETPYQPSEDLKCITPKPTLFISYSWDNKDVAIYIEKELSHLYCIIRDDNNLHDGDDLVAFMKSIRKQDQVILIISDPYLKSQNCMFELIEVFKDDELDNFIKRIHFLVLDSANNVFSIIEHIDYIKYWTDAEEKYDEIIETIPVKNIKNHVNLVWNSKRTSEIAIKIGDVLAYISNHVASTSAERLVNTLKNDYRHKTQLDFDNKMI